MIETCNFMAVRINGYTVLVGEAHGERHKCKLQDKIISE
jgi:hypothetical protein